MILHENRLLADDSHEIPYLIFFRKLGKMSQNLSPAAVMIGTLRVNTKTELNEMIAHVKLILLFDIIVLTKTKLYS